MVLAGVWWLPTTAGVRKSQRALREWERARRIKMEEGVYQNSTPRQRFSRRKPPSQKLLSLAWVLMCVAAVVCFLPCLSARIHALSYSVFVGTWVPQKLMKSHWCVPFTATFSKRRKIGALWSERCDNLTCWSSVPLQIIKSSMYLEFEVGGCVSGRRSSQTDRKSKQEMILDLTQR